MTIEVSISGGVVSCSPPTKDKGHGDNSITWRFEQNTPRSYTFCGLEIPNDGSKGTCFNNLEIKDERITVEDHNPDGDENGRYPYTLYVRYLDQDGKVTYLSTRSGGGGPGDPMIDNK